MKSSAKKIELASVDDLFSTEEGRQDAKLEKIQEIPLSELHPFRNHPFKVKDDEAMMETADSIKQYGVLVPAIARPDPEGGYELVAGHRRHRASELAEKETICRVSDSHYTKTIQFQDINYQLSQNEDKTAIFEGWCDFLNYFDSSIHFQLSFLNLAASEETFANSISIPLQGDAFDSIREEYTTMLQNQLARGNNGLIKTKYLTFGIDADSIKAAKPRLERIETDILNNFKRLGVAARTLDGKERLSQLHAVFHMDEQLPFQFEWDWLAPSGLSTKDFIAPSSFEFRTGKQFRMGKKYGAAGAGTGLYGI